MDRKPNIVWYCLCWNEIDILPFMIDYWKHIASKVVVFDNKSTDGSLELLSRYDWIEVRPYPIDPHDTIDDDIHRKIKSMCWKECKGKGVDWVIVSDLDETVWCRDLFGRLEKYKSENVAIVKPKGYDFVTELFPEYREGLLAHEIARKCVHIPLWDKPIIFDPDRVTEINYRAGGHSLESPVYSGSLIAPDDFYLFHFKYLSLEYLVRKRFATRPRLSEINLRMSWGIEYQYDRDKIARQFNDRLRGATTDVDELLR